MLLSLSCVLFFLLLVPLATNTLNVIMKSFPDVLNPRKSRSRVGVETDVSNRIHVTGASKSFGRSQLNEALKTAGAIAAKTRTDVTVSSI